MSIILSQKSNFKHRQRKLKKEEMPRTQSISVGAVSALKKKFLDIGPPPAEVPAWKRALKKKEVVEEEEGSSSDSDSKCVAKWGG